MSPLVLAPSSSLMISLMRILRLMRSSIMVGTKPFFFVQNQKSLPSMGTFLALSSQQLQFNVAGEILWELIMLGYRLRKSKTAMSSYKPGFGSNTNAPLALSIRLLTTSSRLGLSGASSLNWDSFLSKYHSTN